MLSSWISGTGRRYFDTVWDAVTKAQSQAGFRGHPDYNAILEHVSADEGAAYLALLTNPDVVALLPASAIADEVGGAKVHDFEGHRLSPTTLRYAKVLQDLISLFPRFNGVQTMAEIGVGYGGQARLVSSYAARQKTALRSYHLVDMLPVCLLAQEFLDNFRLHFSCAFQTKSQITRNASWDFVMSNYAFSEFDRELQTEYLDLIIRKAASGYLTMNTGLDHRNPFNDDFYRVEELLTKLPNAVLLAEEPSTYSGNYIIVFGDHAAERGIGTDELRSRIED